MPDSVRITIASMAMTGRRRTRSCATFFIEKRCRLDFLRQSGMTLSGHRQVTLAELGDEYVGLGCSGAWETAEPKYHALFNFDKLLTYSLGATSSVGETIEYRFAGFYC